MQVNDIDIGAGSKEMAIKKKKKKITNRFRVRERGQCLRRVQVTIFLSRQSSPAGFYYKRSITGVAKYEQRLFASRRRGAACPTPPPRTPRRYLYSRCAQEGRPPSNSAAPSSACRQPSFTAASWNIAARLATTVGDIAIIDYSLPRFSISPIFRLHFHFCAPRAQRRRCY